KRSLVASLVGLSRDLQQKLQELALRKLGTCRDVFRSIVSFTTRPLVNVVTQHFNSTKGHGNRHLTKCNPRNWKPTRRGTLGPLEHYYLAPEGKQGSIVPIILQHKQRDNND